MYNSNADPGPCCINFSINPLRIPWKDVYKVVYEYLDHITCYPRERGVVALFLLFVFSETGGDPVIFLLNTRSYECLYVATHLGAAEVEINQRSVTFQPREVSNSSLRS